MSESPISLDQLHDLALPERVSWWPLASGWYVLAGVLLLCALMVLWRVWLGWRANAYRRAALRELAIAPDAAAVALVLRRTALAIAPRALVASKQGADWADWLSAQSGEVLSGVARAQLASAPYAPECAEEDSRELHVFAQAWIRNHRAPNQCVGGQSRS